MNFSYIESIRTIRTKLEKEGFHDYSEEILKSQLGGAMAGEIILMVCSKLLEIKKKDKEVFEVVENETEELINYANSVGLYPKY